MEGHRAILLIFTFCVSKTISADIIVKTSYGEVIGKEVASIIQNKTFFSFLGIPYAKPPLGKLRFKAPEVHDGWEEPLITKKSRKYCMQLDVPVDARRLSGVSGDEDCLYLNIHTPIIPPENQIIKLKPVIVLIHNEYLKTTTNITYEYGPDFIMDEDVLFVSISYRLGALGFLSFEDAEVPGNNGLRDIILALRWLNLNILNFGGDNTKITLMGSNTGGALVDVLLYVPQVKGLFSGVIMQSGTSWDAMHFADKIREKAIALTEYVTEMKPTTSSLLIRYLQDAEALKIVDSENYAVHADEPRAIQRSIVPFGMVVEPEHDDAVITKLPENSKIDINVPIMIGYNSRESIGLMHRYLMKPQFLTFADRDFLFLFPIRTGYRFQIDDSLYFSAVNEIKDYYFDEGYIKISRPGEYITYLNDLLTLYHIDYTVRKYSNESAAPVYYYTFDYSGEFNLRKKQQLEEAVTIEGTWGASAGDELCYIFVCKPIKKLYKKAMEDEDSEEINVLKNMVKLWTNFAKTGNPTPSEDGFLWKPATPENKECLVISDELQMKTRIHDEKIKYWDDFLEKYRKIAVDGVAKSDTKDEL